jgi:hypothetical protein
VANDRNVAVAIGVANASKLRYLGAAVNGAKAFYDWAGKLGYEATLLTDEDAPVTMTRLRQTIEKALSQPSGTVAAPIHRCVLYFAGHGLIREAEEGLWLLSDWYTEVRAVAVEVLKRRLYMYNISQITIISDACRSLPSDMQASDLISDGVLGRGPSVPSPLVAVDKFVAAQDGSVAYSIPGENPEDDRCIFTGVLMEGLWGVAPTAFSKLVPKVTSSSLGTYLKTEVPKIAAKYQLTLNPSVSPTFPEDDNVYFGDVIPPPGAPPFPAWPPPESLVRNGPLVVGPANEGVSQEGAPTRGMPRPSVTPPLRPQDDELETSAKFTAQLKSQATSWPMKESGVEVEGAQIAAVWVNPALTAMPDTLTRTRWIVQESGACLGRPTPMLVELDNGKRESSYIALAALPDFGAFVVCDERGAAALRYGSLDNDPFTAEAIENALVAMESGALRGEEASTLALALREGKHAAPVLGAIAAYLYDSAGDLESIQRMANFYIENKQPIPYDVALLAQLEGQWRGVELWAKVPAIAARVTPRQDAPWDAYAIAENWGVVGGLWPWMKQGWTFLDAPEDVGSQLIAPVLLDARDHLTRARFATFNQAGAMLLTQAFALQRNEGC